MFPARVLAERRTGGRRKSSKAELLGLGAKEEEKEEEDESSAL